MARDSKGITQFYLAPTHDPYLPLLHSRRASPPFGCYSIAPTDGRDGQAELTWVAGYILRYDSDTVS